MISKELYNLVIKADKVAKSCGACGTCFCAKFRDNLQGSNLKHFLDWRAKNKELTSCGSVLFYLQDLGIIKISSGVYNIDSGVVCKNLKYTIIKNFQGNKI